MDISIKLSLSKNKEHYSPSVTLTTKVVLVLAPNISYLNRNILKEQTASTQPSSGLEFNFNNPVDDESNKLSTLSIVDLNGDLKLHFPKILFSAKIKNNLTPYKF
ncbi:MAG: hypothetical protein IPH74_15625 [Bacteroidetes bacterium]|nr:hypothetical protein [Bacteroidota bacterium]